MMRVLLVTSEYFPLVKTGGLADVSAALPAALLGIGVDARVLLPDYPVEDLRRVKDAGEIDRIRRACCCMRRHCAACWARA